MTNDDPLLNKQLGDYTIVDLLGQGGMARVYRGYDAKLDRYSAIKVIDSTLAASQDADEYRERFLREARAIARLRHPNIVNLYQFGEANGAYYMAMAFLEGRDLRQLLQDYADRSERMPAVEVLSIARDIASALDYAHQSDVIHRDVKPSNVMVTTAGAVLMDFGLALHVPEGTTGNIFGTAHYIAPEQAVSSAQAVPQSDLYSLGIVLYEMLAGHVPFDDPSAMSVALKHISEPPPPPRRFNPAITPQVESVLLRALEKEPQDRYPNGSTLLRALESALEVKDEDKTIKDPPLPRPASTPPKLTLDVSDPVAPASRTSNTMWIIIATVVAIVLIGGLLLLNSGGNQADVGATQTAVALAAEATITPGGSPIATTTTGVNLRSGPSTVFNPPVGSIPANTAAEIIAVNPFRDWYKLRSADYGEGWVAATFVVVSGDLSNMVVDPGTPSPTISPTVGPSDTPPAVPTATVPATPALESVRDLTARSGPGSQYPSVATLPAGERADIVGISEDGAWFQVALSGGLLGWVSASPALVHTAGVDLSSVPIVAAPTNTPTDVPTERPTLTPTPGIAPTIVSETAEVILYYDPDTLVLLNRSERAVDVSRLTFIQTTADGRELSFASDRWEGSRPTSALPAGDCFQVWTIDLSLLPKPNYCNLRHAQAQVGPQSWFWISDAPDTTFQVVRRRSGRADEVLATCLIDAGECEIPLGRGTVVASPATATPRPTETAVATEAPTDVPTELATQTSSATSDGQILLTWDDESLALFNRSNSSVDISGLTFVQVTSAGRQLSFDSGRWDGGSRSIYALPSGDCFQVWRDSVTSTLPIPDGCDARGSWQAAGPIRWFWISDDADATFEVRRGSRVLAVCPISADECAFDPDEDSASVPSVAGASTSTDAQVSIGAPTGLVLIYDADSLVIFNGTDAPVDVSGLTFVQTAANGSELSFSSDRWDGSHSLPSGDCFQVWRDSRSDAPEPDYCDSRQSWQIVSAPRWFWTSDDANATFVVRRDDVILAECRIGDGQCALNLDGAGVSV